MTRHQAIPTPSDKKYLIRGIPADLWKEVKVWAAQEQLSVREVILRELRQYVTRSRAQ